MSWVRGSVRTIGSPVVPSFCALLPLPMPNLGVWDLREALRGRMAEAAHLDPQPELHIRADGELAYKRVVAVMSDAAKAGLTRIGFVTDPRMAP